MDWISSFSGLEGVPLLIVIVFTLIGLYVSVKAGFITFNGKGLQVGARDKERAVMRMQIEYINTILDGTIATLPNNLREGSSYFRSKYIISKVKDLFEQIIIFNHIQNDENYITLKQEMVYNLIIKLTEDDYFKTPEFKVYIYDLTKDILNRLFVIRSKA